MRLVALTWAALLLAGCATPSGPLPLAGSQVAECVMPTRTIEVWGTGYDLQLPTGSMGGGAYDELPWLADPEDLIALNIQAIWTASSPLSSKLRLELRFHDERPPEEQPWLEGPSPLTLTAFAGGVPVQEKIRIIVGPPNNEDWPVNAWYIPEGMQSVTVTVTETYRCMAAA